MIKSLNFKIFVGEKLAFNGVIIEKNDNTYGLIIDKSIRLNRVYQNIFFLILEGKYKLDFINKKEFEEKKSTIDCKIETLKIDEGNPFDNINKYIEIFGDNNLKVEVREFELKVNIDNNLNKLCEVFGEEKRDLIFIPYKKNELLNEECIVIADKYVENTTLRDIINKYIRNNTLKNNIEIKFSDEFFINNKQSRIKKSMNSFKNSFFYSNFMHKQEIISEKLEGKIEQLIKNINEKGVAIDKQKHTSKELKYQIEKSGKETNLIPLNDISFLNKTYKSSSL